MQRPELTVQRKFRWWILATIFGLVIANVGVYWAVGLFAARELRQINDGIRTAGYPVTIEELDRYYDPGPGSAETGQEIVRAFHKLNGKPVGKQDPIFFSAKNPGLGDVLDETAIAATRAFVEQNREPLDEILSLVGPGHAIRFPIDFHHALDEEPSYYVGIRSAVRLLRMDALIAGLDGMPERAADRICAAYALADSLREEPILTSQLARGAFMEAATNSLEVILNHTTLMSKQLLRIQQAIDGIHLDSSMVRGLIGERCVSKVYFEARSENTTGSFVDFLYRFRAYRRLEYVSLAKSYKAWIDIGEMSVSDRLRSARRLQATIDNSPYFSNSETKIFAPAIAGAFGAGSRRQAKLVTASTAIAAIRFTRDRGQAPARLTDMVPEYMSEVPSDPFDGKPLRYVQRDKGFVVYALGEDCDDDGGTPPAKYKNLQTEGDVVFRVINP